MARAYLAKHGRKKTNIAAQKDEAHEEESTNEETPFAVRIKWEKLYKKYKMKGKFPTDLEKAIGRINAHEKNNSLPITK